MEIEELNDLLREPIDWAALKPALRKVRNTAKSPEARVWADRLLLERRWTERAQRYFAQSQAQESAAVASHVRSLVVRSKKAGVHVDPGRLRERLYALDIAAAPLTPQQVLPALLAGIVTRIEKRKRVQNPIDTIRRVATRSIHAKVDEAEYRHETPSREAAKAAAQGTLAELVARKRKHPDGKPWPTDVEDTLVDRLIEDVLTRFLGPPSAHPSRKTRTPRVH